MAMYDFIVCPEDGKIYSYQDFVQKIYLESIGEDEKQAYEDMQTMKQEEQEEDIPSAQMTEDIDLCSENINRKTRREKKRSRDGYTVGNYKRKKERKDKNHDKWAEKKNAQKDTCFRLSDRLMGWCPNRDVKKVSAEEEEAEARKNAEWDLTRQQMNYNGAFFRDLIRDRDDKADRIAEYASRIDAYLTSEMEVQDNIFELEDQIKQLQERLTVMKNHKKTLMENRHRAEKNMEYNQTLYDMYDSVIKNQVLGIED